MKYSKRISLVENNDLLDLMQLADRPDVISFAGGFPAPELFPLDELRAISDKVLGEDQHCALQYSSTSGYGPLRDKIAKRMNRKMGVNITIDNIIITSGSQQALDMSGMVFLDERDIVLCEKPSYLGAINAFDAYYPQYVEIETDDDGMVIEDLKEKLETYGDKIRLIYVIPDYQNPTSRCWSEERRIEFLEALKDYSIPVLEDGAYAEVRYEGKAQPSLYSLDKTGKVIYCGSFSKIFCPGFRVAWVASRPEILKEYLSLKPGVDLSTSSLSQRYIEQYLEDYDIEEHIERTLAIYKRKRDLVAEKMKEFFPKEVSYKLPQGGLFFWLTLPEGVDATDLLDQALKENVAFVPGGSFFAGKAERNTIRLNFSNMDKERLVEGIERLGKVMHKYFQN